MAAARSPWRAAVSPPFAEEPDPLLAFSTESGPARKTTSVPEPAGQPVAAPVDPPRPSTPSVPIDSLVARLDRLERALEDSKARVSSVKSEMATLVRVVADIRKQSSGRPAIATAPSEGAATNWFDLLDTVPMPICVMIFGFSAITLLIQIWNYFGS